MRGICTFVTRVKMTKIDATLLSKFFGPNRGPRVHRDRLLTKSIFITSTKQHNGNITTNKLLNMSTVTL